jgi:hypothetical protein
LLASNLSFKFSRQTQKKLVGISHYGHFSLWTTTFVDDWTRLIHYTFFKTKCDFISLKNYFIDKYIYFKIYFKILSLIQNILKYHLILFFKVHGLFISPSTFNCRHSPKLLSSAETDLLEPTTVQQLWACVTTKKLILDNFLKSSKLSIVAAKIVRIMSPYTSNASDSHTVLHPLWVVYSCD